MRNLSGREAEKRRLGKSKTGWNRREGKESEKEGTKGYGGYAPAVYVLPQSEVLDSPLRLDAFVEERLLPTELGRQKLRKQTATFSALSLDTVADGTRS